MKIDPVAELVTAYIRVVYVLVLATPVVTVVLISASYVWDAERGPDCDFSRKCWLSWG